jgi:hypothetical protein
MKDMYLDFLLSGKKTIKLDPTDKGTIFLANLGLIVPLDFEVNTFSPTSRILQDCVSIHVLRHFTLPLSTMPPIVDGKLDVLETLFETVKHLNYDSLRRALHYSTKKAEINDKQNVLKEAVYSLEFVAILRAWFPLDVDIIPEVNCSKNKADILFSDVNSFRLSLNFFQMRDMDQKQENPQCLDTSSEQQTIGSV